MGSSVLFAGACRRHSAGHGSAGRVRISPFSSHVSEYFIWFTSNIVAGMSWHPFSLIDTNTMIANFS